MSGWRPAGRSERAVGRGGKGMQRSRLLGSCKAEEEAGVWKSSPARCLFVMTMKRLS
jgi:hypothetical protein